MTVDYKCDVCGKSFKTEEEALACEAKHADEKKNREKVAREKEELRAVINKAIEDYMKKFHEFPELDVEVEVLGRKKSLGDILFL